MDSRVFHQRVSRIVISLHGWSWHPLVLICLALSAWLYIKGIARLWRASTRGGGVGTWEAASFASGWIVLVLALVSPLHELGISVGAPLLVLGRPLIPFLWALPLDWRRSLGAWSQSGVVSTLWRRISNPAIAFALHGLALWTWHLPRFYQATLTSEVIHSLQHASFLLTAILFWWTILNARGGQVRRGAAVFYLFATLLQTGALGALLTFSPTLWYLAYAATTG